MGEPNEDGFREVYFQINGQTRNVLIKDNKIKIDKVSNVKVSSDNEVGAPLQGKLVEIKVKEGDKIIKGTPLFVIEAMKMESTINSTVEGVVQKIYIKNNSMVEQDDCLLSV